MQSAAEQACTEFGNGWSVEKVIEGALICTKDSLHWGQSCTDCEKWRLLVWEDGADEFPNDQGVTHDPYSTNIGKYYGGHPTCQNENDLPLCGVWKYGKYNTLF